MTTQVTFRIEEELKKRVMEKAKKEGVSLKTIYLYLTQAWLENKLTLGMIPTYDDTIYTKEDHKAWLQAQEDLKNWDAVTLDELKNLYG